MSLKSLIAPALHQIAWSTGFSTSRAKSLHVGRIVTFHGVGDEYYSVTEFESQLRWLARNFSIVSLGCLVERMDSELTDEIVLTFDDGLRNNFTHAWPILKKLNIPATFFVVPGLIESDHWIWTHELRARLALLPPAAKRQLLPDTPATEEAVLNHVKTLGLRARNDVQDKLRQLTPEFQPAPTQHTRYDLMSWAELQQLDSPLITIGSHSMTHPILSTLTGSELAAEFHESRRMLEDRLQKPIEFFCYPNGSHNPEVIQTAREHYRAAVSNEARFVHPGMDLHQLPRIGIPPDISLLAWRTHRPTA